jgi:ribosome-binding factor A
MANPRTIARLESRILERAAIVLQSEVSDPRASFITVTKVKLSPDLSSGRIYYSVLGSEGDKSKAAHMLESAAGFLQRQIALAIQLRRMPHLKWTYDDSMERADDMARLIKEARARDRTINPHVDDEAAAGDGAPAGGDGAVAAGDGAADDLDIDAVDSDEEEDEDEAGDEEVADEG